jgi:hypothetical protein
MTAKINNNITALLDVLQDDILAEAPPAPRSLTAAQRKDSHRAMLGSFDLDKLLDMQEKMASAIDRMTANVIDPDNPGKLTPAKAEELMAELLDQTEIKDLLEVRRELIRAAVFSHLTEEARDEGKDDPEYQPGYVPVPGMGRKFTREGGARSAPKVDEDLLREGMGDRWEEAYRVEVVPAQIIPEHTEYSLDLEKLMELASSDPAILEVLRKALVPGERTTPRFFIRNL